MDISTAVVAGIAIVINIFGYIYLRRLVTSAKSEREQYSRDSYVRGMNSMASFLITSGVTTAEEINFAISLKEAGDKSKLVLRDSQAIH